VSLKILYLSAAVAQLVIFFLIGCFYLGVNVVVAGLSGAIFAYILALVTVKLNLFGVRNEV
jgi:membrane associated rhomboid family serine protease